MLVDLAPLVLRITNIASDHQRGPKLQLGFVVLEKQCFQSHPEIDQLVFGFLAVVRVVKSPHRKRQLCVLYTKFELRPEFLDLRSDFRGDDVWILWLGERKSLVPNVAWRDDRGERVGIDIPE